MVESGKNVEVAVMRRGEKLTLLEEAEIDEYVKEIEIEKKEAEENAKLNKNQQTLA